jgi:hypothetical protein
MTTKIKLTAMEKRCKEFIDKRKEDNSFTLTIEWVRSKTWGHTPTVRNFGGETIARVSGYGFCKESTILANVLQFLFPIDSEPFKKVRSLGGCGVPSVQTELALHGWELEEVRTTSKAVSIYNIRKV